MKSFPLVYRRILYLLAILLFFVIASLTIIYALGFRYDFDSDKLEKVGFLIIEGGPENAQVFVDGQEKAAKLPCQIRNLLPGEHLVEIKKDAYQTWSKKLIVEESMVTAVKSVQLVLNEPVTEPLLETTISKNPVLSDDGQFTAWINKTNGIMAVELYDYEKQIVNTIDLRSLNLPISVSETTTEEIVSWDNKNYWLLLKMTGQNNRYYLALNSRDPQNSYLINAAEGEFVWDNTKSGQLFRLNQNKLFQQNKDGFSQILSQVDFYDIDGFTGTNYALSVIGQNQQTAVLWKWHSNKAEAIIIFSGSGKLEFCPYYSDQLCVYNPASKNSIVLIDNKLIPLGKNVNQVSTAPAGDKMLILSSNELYLLTNSLIDKNNPVWNKRLLTRYSIPILNAYWHSASAQIVFLLPNEIKMIETDSRDQALQFTIKSSLELTSADQISLGTNKKDSFLYFSKIESGKLILHKIIWQ